MTKMSRRVAFAIGGVLVAMLVVPASAKAEGFLEGTFYIYCMKCKQVDKVENLTRNHECENCKNKSVDGGTGYVVCPKGHWRDNKVEGITKQHLCGKKVGGGIHGVQCEGQPSKPAKAED
jgi:hypothetical protein